MCCMHLTYVLVITLQTIMNILLLIRSFDLIFDEPTAVQIYEGNIFFETAIYGFVIQPFFVFQIYKWTHRQQKDAKVEESHGSPLVTDASNLDEHHSLFSSSDLDFNSHNSNRFVSAPLDSSLQSMKKSSKSYRWSNYSDRKAVLKNHGCQQQETDIVDINDQYSVPTALSSKILPRQVVNYAYPDRNDDAKDLVFDK